MNWITNLFTKHWRSLHFIAIIIFSIFLITGHARINPYINQFVFGVFYSPFAKAKNSIIELQGVASENIKLRQKLVETSLMMSMYEEASRENLRLRSVLGFEPPTGYRLLPAEVISIAGDYLPTSAVINRGSDDSIFIDQPLINQKGLIGRIASVSKDFATVQLLTDPSNRVAARLAESREMGIIKYTVSKGMILDNFPAQGNIQVNDIILSSGLGGVYPAGLKVGRVKAVDRPEHEPFCEVIVEPAVNFHSIEELFLLMEDRQ